MKRLFTILIMNILLWLPLSAQETAQKTMENRAREMHRVIGLSDKEQWKAFMKENYTQALIDKPMRAVAETSDNGTTTTSTSQSQPVDKLEAKVVMFQRLHEDFGKSKIISIKTVGEKAEMVVKADNGLSATFILKFENNKPYLIDGLGIEVQDVDR